MGKIRKFLLQSVQEYLAGTGQEAEFLPGHYTGGEKGRIQRNELQAGGPFLEEGVEADQIGAAGADQKRSIAQKIEPADGMDLIFSFL